MFGKKKEQENKVFEEIKKLLELLEVKVAKHAALIEAIEAKLRKKIYKDPPEVREQPYIDKTGEKFK